MLTREDITDNIPVGSYVQVVADSMPGVPGQLKAVTDTAIVVGPWDFGSKEKNQRVNEEFGGPAGGSVSSLTVIPLDTLHLIFKLNIEE